MQPANFPAEPINNIEWLPADTLQPNPWNPNRVAPAELKLLELSLLTTGWIQPVLVNRDGLIIDGFHRWRLAQDSEEIRSIYGGLLPVARLDIDRPDAMMMTIRINRAKGRHESSVMSRIVHEMLEEYGYSKEEIGRAIGANKQEVELLAQDGVFTKLDIKNWAYSPAWYPKLELAEMDPAEQELATEEDADD